MYCPYCGVQNATGAAYCTACGQTLSFQQQQTLQSNPRPDIATYLVPAILVTLFCCQPFGIVAIVYAALTTSKLSSGDYAGATDCSRNAERWCWLAFWFGLIPMLLYAFFMVIGIVTGALN